LAPDAESVTLPPAQMDGEVEDAVTVGKEFTVTVTVCVFEQLPVVPVMVYV
jgi:hypothetical protein